MTSVVKTAIINAALSHLGEPGYADIDESPPPPKLAKALAQIDLAQAWVLRRHPWLSCMEYLTLNPSGRTGNFKFSKVYDLPESVIRIWAIHDGGKCAKGTQTVSGAEKQVIFSDAAGPIYVEAVVRRPWEAHDPDLQNVISYELAARLAGPIQDNAELAARLRREAATMMGLAEGAESGEWGGDALLVESGFAGLRALGA
jgi:hypothetical protein